MALPVPIRQPTRRALRRKMPAELDFSNFFGNGESGAVWSAGEAGSGYPSTTSPLTYTTPTLTTLASAVGDAVGLQLSQAPPGDGRGIVNLLTYTEQFDNAVWTKSSTTVVANAAVAPDGTTTADRIVEVAATAVHYVEQTATITAGVAYSRSTYAKAGERTKFEQQFNGDAFGAVAQRVLFDLTAVTATSVAGTSTGSIVDVGDGWYRCTMTTPAASSTVAAHGMQTRLADASGAVSYLGDITKGIYIWGAQLNQGTLADYQPNRASLGGSDDRTGGSNLLLWTQEFDHPAWTKTRSTVTSNAIAAPDGSMSADKLVEDAAAANSHQITVAQTLVSGATYTLSIYARAGERNWLSLNLFDSGNHRTFFDLTNGVVGTNASGNTANIEDDGDGWYRVSISRAVDQSAVVPAFNLSSADGAVSYDGDGTSGLYLWGAHLNLGTTADTYSRNMDHIGGLLRSLTAFQATAASKPTWGRLPRGGRRNRLAGNMMTGAAAGAPGTQPTSWTIDTNKDALVRTLSLPGSVDNIACLDLNLAGTASATASWDTFFSPSATTIAASPSQAWTISAYLAIAAGSLTGISLVRVLLFAYDSGGAFLTTVATSNDIKASLTSSIQRFTATGTTPVNTAYVRALVKIDYTNGGSVNFTLRMGEPQLEVAASASTVQHVTTAYDITESGVDSIPMEYYDGGDHLTTGVQSYGKASLHADASQEWTVAGAWSTLDPLFRYAIAKRSGAAATLSIAVAGSSFQVSARRTASSAYVFDSDDGLLHTYLLRWDRTALELWVDGVKLANVTVGTDADIAENITIGCRTESSPSGAFAGFNEIVLLEDRALSTSEIQATMDQMNEHYRGVYA